MTAIWQRKGHVISTAFWNLTLLITSFQMPWICQVLDCRMRLWLEQKCDLNVIKVTFMLVLIWGCFPQLKHFSDINNSSVSFMSLFEKWFCQFLDTFVFHVSFVSLLRKGMSFQLHFGTWHCWSHHFKCHEFAVWRDLYIGSKNLMLTHLSVEYVNLSVTSSSFTSLTMSSLVR